jgi:hypothetical protein
LRKQSPGTLNAPIAVFAGQLLSVARKTPAL